MDHSPSNNKVSRRSFLKASSGLAVAGSFAAPRRAAATPARPPNIAIILTDQEREEVPRSLLHLPNRAALEERGIRLTHAFATAPQCSPSRSTLMTGLYPHQAGVVTNVDRTSLGRRLSPRLPALGSVFKDHGYTTAYLGKWHLTNGLGGGVNPDEDSEALRAYGFQRYHFVADAGLADAAANWLKSAPSTPWLLVVSFPYLTHDITGVARLIPELKVRPGVKLPANFDDDLKSKPAPQEEFLQRDQGRVSLGWGKEEWLRYRSHYLSLIEQADKYLGVILEAIRRRTDADDTIVVYSSDHGDMGGAHHLPFKGPFMYDELLRVPLVISWPRRFRRPVESSSLVSSLDLAPTLATLAGLEWPRRLPGKDYSLLFDHPDEMIRAAVFAEYYGKQHWVNPIRTLRTMDWKYNIYVAPGQELAAELYDLRKDAGEVHNLADNAEYRHVRQALGENLLEWRRRTKDPML